MELSRCCRRRHRDSDGREKPPLCEPSLPQSQAGDLRRDGRGSGARAIGPGVERRLRPPRPPPAGLGDQRAGDSRGTKGNVAPGKRLRGPGPGRFAELLGEGRSRSAGGAEKERASDALLGLLFFCLVEAAAAAAALVASASREPGLPSAGGESGQSRGRLRREALAIAAPERLFSGFPTSSAEAEGAAAVAETPTAESAPGGGEGRARGAVCGNPLSGATANIPLGVYFIDVTVL